MDIRVRAVGKSNAADHQCVDPTYEPSSRMLSQKLRSNRKTETVFRCFFTSVHLRSPGLPQASCCDLCPLKAAQVIPNDTVSIYTRLWCVYEEQRHDFFWLAACACKPPRLSQAYLGTQWQKIVIMPMRLLREWGATQGYANMFFDSNKWLRATVLNLASLKLQTARPKPSAQCEVVTGPYFRMFFVFFLIFRWLYLEDPPRTAKVLQTLFLPWCLGVLVGSICAVVLWHHREIKKYIIILAMFTNLGLNGASNVCSALLD